MNLLVVIPLAVIAAALATRGVVGGRSLEVFVGAFLVCIAAAVCGGLVARELVSDPMDPSDPLDAVVGAVFGLATLARPRRLLRARCGR